MAENKEIIAIDIGGTNIRIARVKNHKIIELIKCETPKTVKEIMNVLYSGIEKFNSSSVKGIGIGCPGPLKNGVIENPPNLPFRYYNLQKEIKKKFKKKVVVCNDAKCVALAEAKIGCKKNNFVVLTLGTGIGGGIIINNELYLGDGNAGEIGSIIIDGEKTFEKAWQQRKEWTKKEFGKPMGINDLIKMKNKKAEEMLDKIANYLGIGIASMINVLDPEVVVLAGGPREAGDKFLDKIEKYVHKYQLIPREVPIIWSKFDYPGVLGASLLIR
jgi:glucokinase